MKKLILLILALLVALSAFVSCEGIPFLPSTPPADDGNGDGGGGDDGKEPENLIYNADSELNLVISSLLSENALEKFWSELGSYTGNYPKIVRDSEPAATHEIVVGPTNRPVSVEAYRRLAEMKKSEGEQGMVFYSDGASLAVAYDEDKYGRTIEVVIEELLVEYVRNELILEKNYAKTTTFNLLESIKEKDEAVREELWREFESKLNANNKSEIVRAYKGFYDLIDEGMAIWMASLFDPDVCVCDSLYGMTECTGENSLCGTAGFYFTQSGRDTIGHLPNVEATGSIYSHIVASGMCKGIPVTEFIPKEYGEKIVEFVLYLQDPVDGNFYHPQWGKNITAGRRGRDLSNALGILDRYGVEPLYATAKSEPASFISNVKLPTGLGESSVALVSRAVLANTVELPPEFRTLEVFAAYLEGLDIDNKSYSAGNELGAQWAYVNAAGPEYVKMLGEFLDSHQRADNGLWHKNADYYGINGLMKIACVYDSMQREIPRAELALEAAVSALTSTEEPNGIVDVWNPWVAISKIIDSVKRHESNDAAKKIINGFYAKAPAAIKATTANIAKYKKPDGSFSYTQKYACSTMQMAPCGVPNTAEGDIDAMKISSSSMVSSIAQVLGMSPLPFFGQYEAALFLNELNARGPVRKAPVGHNMTDWAADEIEGKPCDVAGTKSRYCLGEGCLVNGESCTYKITMTDPDSIKEHTVESYVPNNDATCNGYGTMSGVCTACGSVQTVLNTDDKPNGQHTAMSIVHGNALKSAAVGNQPAVYYKSCSTCGYLTSGTFKVKSGDVTDSNIWPGISNKNYTSSSPTFSEGIKASGAYTYVTVDEDSDNSYLRFEKVNSASDLFVYMKNGGLQAGATKYVYDFDFRWSGAVNDGKIRGFYMAPDDSSREHKHLENWYQLTSDITFNPDGTSTLNLCNSTPLTEGEWYNVRYEFTVAKEGGYELRIFVDDVEISTVYTTKDEDGNLLPLKFKGSGMPFISIVMYQGSTPDTQTFDIDNYSYYCETE